MDFPSSSSSSSAAAAAARASMAEKSRRHLYGDAEAQAALLLRHRLFPRAMAWNATQQQQVQQAQPQVQQQQQQAHDWRRQRAEDEYQQLQPQQHQRDQYTDSAVGQSTSSQRQYMLHRQQQHQQQQQYQQQQQQAVDVTGAFTAQLHAFHLNDRSSPPRAAAAAEPMSEVPAQAVHEAMNFARSFPLLHATSIAENQLRRQKENVNSHKSNNYADSNASNTTGANNIAGRNNCASNNSNPFLSGSLPSQDAREKLFHTMGKWFDGASGSAHNSTANSRSSFASSTDSITATASAMGEDGAPLLQHIPRKPNFDHVLPPPPPPISISFASTAATTSTASFGHAFSPVQLGNSFVSDVPSASHNNSTNNGGLRRVNLVLQDPVFETPKAASFSGTPLPIYAESRGTPSPTNSNSNWSVASEPRMRSPPRDSGSSNGKKRHRATPAPSLAKALLTGCGAKRCSFEDCVKIAVSKGLCRGHGGGRRCQFMGCTKCAQSRSPYCWAHGGGKRCEAPNCRRSRKTKHFCVDHVEMEASVPVADSDESMDCGPSTVASDVDMALSSIERSLSTSDLQHQQPQQKPSRRPASAPKNGETRAKLALQLPSLNDALKRPFPSPDVIRQQQPAATVGVQRTQEERAFYQQQVQKFSFELPKTSR
ncbi:hypothetical protein Gpo141_00008464 [Globisporangium polare]